MITCGTQVVAGSSGGGAPLPATPADALLDAGAPSTMLGLNSSGVGEALSASAARSRMGVVATPTTTPSSVIAGATAGGVLITDASGNAAVATGTLGYAMVSNGPGAAPTFQSLSTPSWLSLYDASALYLGGESAFGWAQADYVTASAAAAVPAFGPGQSIVACIYPGATPTGIEMVACHASGAGNRGWTLDFGRNAASRRQCNIYLFGLNGGAGVQLVGSEFTVGAAYVIAIVVKADKSVRYSCNGGAVQTISALSGTYAPPTSADTYDLGSTRAFASLASYYPLTSALIGEVRTYSNELSDADLVAACAGRATGTIPDVTTGTVSTRLLPSDFAGGRRVKAQTGVTWILKGGASIAPV